MSTPPQAIAEPDPRGTPPVLLDAGFRPFFLLGASYAALAMLRWLLVYAGALDTPAVWTPAYWHGHEMVFGFVAAAIAGFLLTAVPNWTGTLRLRGAPLAVLAGVWLAGRAALWLTGVLPGGVVAVADVAFLPALAVVVGRPIWRSGRRNNHPVVGVLLLLALANLAVHAAHLTGNLAGVRRSLHLALYLVVALLAIISGRIVPLFMRNALARRGLDAPVVSSPRLERALAAVLLAAIAVAMFAEGSLASGLASLACAALFVLRQAQWQPRRSLAEPILWVLHVGHAWLAVGFALIGLGVFVQWLPAATALHALTAGAMGTSIAGVVARVSLGHTGRAMRATPTMVLAFGLVIAGAGVRVLVPLALPDAYAATVTWGGALWLAGFGLLAIACTTLLTRPRADE